MKTPLDQLETRLQDLFEGSARLLPIWDEQNLLVHYLVTALQEMLVPAVDGSFIAPHVFTIFVNPAYLSAWQSRQNMLDILALSLRDAALEAGVHFANPPTLRLAVDDTLTGDALRIQAEIIEAERDGNTAAVSLGSLATPTRPGGDPRPENAFLIINGSQIYPLRQVVLNIGRRLDNHLVVDDPRVSRVHAQLRAVHGHYILFDLNSTGGTYINGQRVTQHQLKPGDVISLAGVPLIYGEDIPPEDTGRLGDTTDLGPFPTSEKP